MLTSSCVKNQSRGGVWVVEFDHPGKASLGVVSSQRQLVCSLDMVNHTRAHTHCLVPGDPVLSPWEPDLRRYGPGKVMAATQRRDGFGGTSQQHLCLHFYLYNLQRHTEIGLIDTEYYMIHFIYTF